MQGRIKNGRPSGGRPLSARVYGFVLLSSCRTGHFFAWADALLRATLRFAMPKQKLELIVLV
jgi:hypothetical protein